MKTILRINLIFVLVAFITLTGCVSKAPPAPEVAVKHVPPPADFERASPGPYYDVMPPAEGSLWSAGSNNLFSDNKAFRVGDTVIIDIVENSSSSLTANTTAERDRSINIKAPNMMGYMKSLQAGNDYLDPNNLLDVEFNNELEGKGSSDRSGQVTASIGARVMEVFPNGNLSIKGQRTTKVNFEEQYIVISGIIRPSDIMADNRVKSTYLADARIEYYGKGDLTDQQRPGWMSRILTHVWPF